MIRFGDSSRAEVLEKLFFLWNPVPQTETVPIEAACGRITARDIHSRVTMPEVHMSSRDGIAVKSAAFLIGVTDYPEWKEGVDYARADTGDDFDDRYDAVIQIEDVTFHEKGGVSLPPGFGVTPGMNVSGRGSIIREGEAILEKGLPIRPCDMGTLARGAVWDVPVVKKPVAAFIPTGDELIPLRETLRRGENIDTNSIMASRMIAAMGAAPKLFPIQKDNKAGLESVLKKALSAADIVVINGGSSKGAEDHNARLLSEMGRLVCYGVNSAPGRPLAVAIIDGKAVVNLPGPMLAAYFGLDWCVRAIVCHALGIPVPKRPVVRARLMDNDTPSRQLPPGFEFLARVIVTRTADGWEAWPVPFGRVDGKRTQGFHSGQCAIKGSIAPGREVDVELLYGEEYFAPLHKPHDYAMIFPHGQ
jgi:molybdopterin molybdotransferase/putative molybdopterin biosynthesis protein